ncbi:YARHG domain-containing protein [Carboxylicivirga marina]|uniref:YARHG domain-containing protein n=1 Tax=Carboxylicivirga marina TaxID=2800988 RepID=UPI00259668E4|nr:YARHG domain-containing protein [uncultured Carboxylicivirga sp.]
MARLFIVLFIVCFNSLLILSQSTKIPNDFPTDYIVREWWPSCYKGTYYFFNNSDFVFEHGGIGNARKKIDLGKWKVKEGKIYITIETTIGVRGVGNQVNKEANFAANPDDYYIFEDYTNFEQWNHKSEIISFHDFLHSDCQIDTILKASKADIQLDKYRLDGDYKVASCRLLKEADIINLSKKELRLMRNEIFARYGYTFKSLDLQKHFLSKDWYHGNSNDVDRYLTDVEMMNIKFIKEFERK